MNNTPEPKRSASSWLMELSSSRREEYALSVFTALLGVACSLIPYFIIIRIITALINGTAELTECLTLCAWMAVCWILRYVLHSVSTSLSHHATFHVLANTRTRLLDKLATLPLGTVLDRSSGSYKNIIVERVDSIETTLAHLLPEMTSNIVAALADVLSGEDMKRPEKAEKLPADNSIELKNVRFAYHDKEVLHGINLRVKPGTVNALVGPSGSGKSTIARLIASLWDVKDGIIELGGVDIRTLPLKDCADRIAYVSQDNYLFDLSVMDNIRMGRKGASDEEVIAAAEKCGCHEFIMGLEKGYQTLCGASGGHLSGGERQRISIARAMLKDAPIVILDEATSYTDPENEAVIQSALARLVRGKTLLVIAHRLSTIADADQIIVVNKGQIEAAGTQAELLRSCPLYKTMWEAHISVKDDGEVA